MLVLIIAIALMNPDIHPSRESMKDKGDRIKILSAKDEADEDNIGPDGSPTRIKLYPPQKEAT